MRTITRGSKSYKKLLVIMMHMSRLPIFSCVVLVYFQCPYIMDKWVTSNNLQNVSIRCVVDYEVSNSVYSNSPVHNNVCDVYRALKGTTSISQIVLTFVESL